MSGARVLLIGGAGLLGRHAARAFGAAGHHVTVLTRGARPVSGADEALVGDRRDAAALAAALDGRRVDFTVDLLAYDADDVARLLHVPRAVLGRLVLISSGQVYLVAQGAVPPFREEDAGRPPAPEPAAGTPDHAEWRYGVGKRRAEEALLALRVSHGVRATVLRLPIVQGAGDDTLRLWAYLERLLDGGPIVLPDGGARPTRFVWAADVARTLVALLERDEPPGPVYNLAQPDVLPLRTFLELVAAAAGVAPRFVEAPWPAIAAAGMTRAFSPYAGPWASVPDPARAAAELGFRGTAPSAYLPEVVGWHLERRPGASHPGYAQRPAELALARRLETVGGAA